MRQAQEAQDADAGTAPLEFEFNNDESLCAVARPFSGDVIALIPHV
jgi:hypothetical protein